MGANIRSFPRGSAIAALVGPVDPPGLHVMTLNVRRRMPAYWLPPADRWSRRRPLLGRVLAVERPSLLGLQEVMPDQSRDIRDMLGPRYDGHGRGRTAGRDGERCEIHFDAGRLDLLEASSWWLFDEPNVPGTRSFGNLLPRIVVQARLLDRCTGVHFNVLVTQLDHLSAQSRRESARLLRSVVAGRGEPTILMGDFNVGPTSSLHQELADGLVLKDSLESAERLVGGDGDSYTRYRLPGSHGRRWDWILVSPGVRVQAAGVNAIRVGGLAVSDHEPVQAVLRW